MFAHQRTRILFRLAVTLLLVGRSLAEEDEIEEEDPVPHSVRVESCDG